MQPTLRNGTIYELQEKDSGYANLYLSYHRLHNTNNDLHLHCWFNGEDDAFASTMQYQHTQFKNQYAIENKIEYDLGLRKWGRVTRPAPVAFEGSRYLPVYARKTWTNLQSTLAFDLVGARVSP